MMRPISWGAPYMLQKCNVILLAVKSRQRKTTHKYGIEIPSNVAHAMELNRSHGITMWRDDLAKDMFNFGVVFEVLE